jgi:hypothetical protein
MKRTLLLISLCLATPALAQFGPPPPPYGGGPMWDRGGDYGYGGRWPRTPYGPQGDPCIRFGYCQGPRYSDDPEQSWRRPVCRDGWGQRVPCR